MGITNMNKSKQISKRELLEVIDWLIDNFSGAFAKKANQVKPLKIGIYEDILDFCARMDVPPYSHKKLRDALNYYSSSPAYLLAQKAGSVRVDLYGNEVEDVTEEQAKYSYQRYQARYAKKEEKPNREA